MDVSMFKTHLGDELFTQVEQALSGVEDLTVIHTNDGSWVPKARIDELTAKQKTDRSTIASLTQQLTDAKKAGENAVALQATIDTLKQQIQDRDTTITGMKRSGRIREALAKARAKDASVVERLLDASKIGEDDKGNLTGLDDQIKALQESSGYLFDEQEDSHGGWGGGRNPDAGGARHEASNASVNNAIRAAAGYKN